jgi:hypothetical protein
MRDSHQEERTRRVVRIQNWSCSSVDSINDASLSLYNDRDETKYCNCQMWMIMYNIAFIHV